MRHILKHLKLVLVFFALIACDDDTLKPVTPVNQLVAAAGPDQSVKVNTSVSLDGSQSSGGNNKPISYQWTFTSKPRGSASAFSTSQLAKTTFTPDIAGLYIIQLTITQNTFSATDVMVVTVTNNNPTQPSTVRLTDHINGTTTLTNVFDDPAQPDYVVVNDIEVRGDLIVMPGVVVAFEENRVLQIISGSIRAKGTQQSGITFKGLIDRPGYWKGIVLYSNSTANEFDYVTVEHAGSATQPETNIKSDLTLAGTPVSGAALKITNSKFLTSGGYGLYVQGMSTLNGFSNNILSNNAGVGAYITASQLHLVENSNIYLNNGIDGVETGGAILTENQITWKKLSQGAYIVTSDIITRAGITVEPGALLKMKSNVTISITQNGYLNAIGTAATPIIFTSLGSNVRWNGIFFNSQSSNNKLQYCEVSNAAQNRIADADQLGNIVVGHGGKVTVENSVIKNSLGYGLVVKASNQVNQDFVLVNTFENLQKGNVYPKALNYPDRPSLTGVWLDEWSFNQGYTTVAEEFFNTQNKTWFAGAPNPWAMNTGKGFGIKFEPDGKFKWLIAEHSPNTGCESYSAEYLTGTSTSDDQTIVFEINYWRSKFVNACDPTWNVDIDVEPSDIPVRYEYERVYNVLTGDYYWELIIINPDDSKFSLYRK